MVDRLRVMEATRCSGRSASRLRLASYQARHEGWLAEHMLIVGCRYKDGPVRYIAGAFPSACGKTNMAMLRPPASMPGWKTWTVGDDIAWIRPGSGRPSVGRESRGRILRRAAGNEPQHESDRVRHDPARHHLHERGAASRRHALVGGSRRSAAGRGARLARPAVDAASSEKATHPNARFTTPAANCATLSPEFENPAGVPLDAIMFGARRQQRVPLVYESKNWQHGVFLGATLSSETTAAASGKTGVLRRDPMAMLAFCGYNMGDYFEHWLEMGRNVTSPPTSVPRQLVPHRFERKTSLARLRREPPRGEMDFRAV